MKYRVTKNDEAPVVVEGKALWNYSLVLAAGESVKLTIVGEPTTLRSMPFPSDSPEALSQWQGEVREKLAAAMKFDDLLATRASVPLDVQETKREDRDGYTWTEYTIQSTPGRRIPVVVTTPLPRAEEHPPYPPSKGEKSESNPGSGVGSSAPVPAVVCITGHGGDRYVTYTTDSIYKGFATELAKSGFVTITMDVGQHEVYEAGRTLMGERLWDTMRCADFLTTMQEVDAERIGCAGLSLGGEMAMWLGAMDTRVKATVSAGFLTTMDHMEVNHCMCWKFDGLRELVDWTDIYAMHAPRALMCQNGLKEPYNDFNVSIARQAMGEIRGAYAVMGAAEKAVLAVHDGAHEIDLPSLLDFLRLHLTNRTAG